MLKHIEGLLEHASKSEFYAASTTTTRVENLLGHAQENIDCTELTKKSALKNRIVHAPNHDNGK